MTEFDRVDFSNRVKSTNKVISNVNTPALADVTLTTNNGLTPPVGLAQLASPTETETSFAPRRAQPRKETGFTGSPETCPPVEVRDYAAHEITVRQDTINYLRADWFDNEGYGATKRTGRHRINLHFNFKPGQKFVKWTAKVCAENRYWKRNVNIDDSFYRSVWREYETIWENANKAGEVFEHKPRLGHIHFNQTIVPYAEAMFLKWAHQPAVLMLWIEDFRTMIQLDEEPKGKEACPALKAYGFYERPALPRQKERGIQFALAHLAGGETNGD